MQEDNNQEPAATASTSPYGASPTDSMLRPTPPPAAPTPTPTSPDSSSSANYSPPTPETNIPVSEPTPLKPVIGGKKKSRKGLVISLVLLLLAAGGAAAWYVMNKNKNEPVTNNTASTQLQEIEHLRVASVEGPASVFFPDEGILGVQTILDHQVYEGLVGFDTGGAIQPLIAQSWTNPDQNTWVFTLRPNVKFQTGKVLTAQDVKASLDSLKKYDYWSLFVSTISSVTVSGNLELTVKTKEPDALLLNRLTFAYISDLSVKDKAGQDGTGSYKLDTTAKNTKTSTTLVAFDDYYGNRAKTRKLTYTIYKTDADVVKALKDDKADIAETLPYANVTKELTAAGFVSTETETQGVFGLYMNQKRTSTTVLKNKQIRLAIAQALDRQSLVDKVGSKNVPTSQVIPKSLPGYDASLSAPTFDLAAAKATLKKAGYKDQPLEFVYIKELQDDAPILIAQLKAAGLNIKAVPYAADDIDKALADLGAGKFDFFGAAYTSDFGDARDILGGILQSKESTYPTLSDPTYDKLLSDSDKEFDAVKRIALLQQANKYVIDNLDWIPLRNGVYASFHKPNLELVNIFNGGGSVGTYYRNVGLSTNE